VPLFWTKRSESDRTIYTRSRKQKTTLYLLIILGLGLWIGLPISVVMISALGHLIASSLAGIIFFMALIAAGVALMLVTAIGGMWMMNSVLSTAARKNKKTNVTHSGDIDTIVVYN
jgi:uncharacterized protein YacL